MTVQKFISKLNWRQIVIHFVASCFFIFAFATLAYLHNTKLLDYFRLSDQRQQTEKIISSHYSTGDLINFIRFPLYSAQVGLLTAFLISLFISIRRHWFWLNSLIAYLLAFCLHRFDLLGWKYLKKVFLSIGQLFNNTLIELWVNGTILLTIGLLLFFYRPLIKFINKSK